MKTQGRTLDMTQGAILPLMLQFAIAAISASRALIMLINAIVFFFGAPLIRFITNADSAQVVADGV